MKLSLFTLIGTLALFLILGTPAAHASPKKKQAKTHQIKDKSQPPSTPIESARRKMSRGGIPRKFSTEILANYDSTDRDRVVALNALGFLVKPADYDAHMSARAVTQTGEFIDRNLSTLRETQKRYGVAPEIIASLLWVETKHGQMLGQHSVASTYLSLLQSDHPLVIKATLATLGEKVPKVTRQLRTKVRERSRAKAAWALEELRALAKMYRRNPKMALELKGSFAGAFGVPQFIPSSYQRWASSLDAKRAPDLFRIDDAIASVGNYLKNHGWKKRQVKTWAKAIHSYNHADGYVSVIRRIAECAKQGREPAKQKATAKPRFKESVTLACPST